MRIPIVLGAKCNHILCLDDPWRTLTGLATLEIASPNIERDLTALGPFAVAVYRDVVVVAEAAHALLGPSVAIPSRLARTIEETGDLWSGINRAKSRTSAIVSSGGGQCCRPAQW
jgi:hypothetical protein